MNTGSNPLRALCGILLSSVLSSSAASVNATYANSTTVPVTAASYTATGNTVNLSLNFAPVTGTSLTVVKNTGLALIQGVFDNLAQGQRVDLTFRGVSYPFVANYFGGTGNDLVLQWANTRLLAWGANSKGQLGRGNTELSTVPVAVDTTGVLAGAAVLSAVAGGEHSLALTAAGEVAAWGDDDYGQLGNGDWANRTVAVKVTDTGVLVDKTIRLLASTNDFTLALCTDGTLVAWGDNTYGQLGNGSKIDSRVPVVVDATGALAGKTVTAIAAGVYHSLALCADGTLFAWGDGGYGQLGNDRWGESSVPMIVNQGVLAGRTAVAVAAGWHHSMALCADGTLAVWGNNNAGQLGDGTTTNRLVPVSVNRFGVLAGKTITAITAGGEFSLALCSDGTVASWGKGNYGQLGDGSFSDRQVPVSVTRTGVLAGKTITHLEAGSFHVSAVCSDGTLVAWGANNSGGALGNGSFINSNVPVLANTAALRSGERFIAASAGGSHSLGLVASPPPAIATTLAVTGISDIGATLKGTVNPNGLSTTVSFQYGLTTTYDQIASASPAVLSGTTTAAASTALTNLVTGTTYHYRVVATSAGGTVYGEDYTFATSKSASLVDLGLSVGELVPGFASTLTTYSASVPYAAASVTMTPVPEQSGSTVTVNGVQANGAGVEVALNVGNNSVAVVVTPADAPFTKTYSVMVTRLPQTYGFSSSASVPVIVSGFKAAGHTVEFGLNYAPTVGTDLMVVKNTGATPIQGTFSNLTQGQAVNLTYNGMTYPFVANYFGGTGNDLMLQWGNVRVVGWGDNGYGQVGDGSSLDRLMPVAVGNGGELAGRTVLATGCGDSHSLALAADGAVFAWGNQLGDGSGGSRAVPVAVDPNGVLFGRTVIAVAAGATHSLASCSDGTVVAWGKNDYGKLGNNRTNTADSPVEVVRSNVLAGKTVIALATGYNHSLALTSDGTLAAWGSNGYGVLGNNGTEESTVPTAVDQSGVLLGKTVTAIAAASYHNLALCSDGTLAAWGSNGNGQLGTGGTGDGSKVPVLVNRSGVLAGKTVVAIEAGNNHSLALCSDGTLAAWGSNSAGQLGNGNTTSSSNPVLVNRFGVLSGKTVIAIEAGIYHNLALCSDGTLAAWGNNSDGSLGNNTTTNSSVPVLVNSSSLKSGEIFSGGISAGGHSLATVAMPPPPTASSLAASGVRASSVTLNANVNAQGRATSVSFEYGRTTDYGTTVAAVPASLSGVANTACTAAVTGLAPGTIYHFRVIATSTAGTVKGDDRVFTTIAANLAGLSVSGGPLMPAFNSSETSYAVTVPFTTSSITVTPVTIDATALVRINGQTVAAGGPSGPLALAVGSNPVSVVVTGAGGEYTLTYVVNVTRIPEVFTFSSATHGGLTAADFNATGLSASFALNFAPVAGTGLVVVDNTGANPIAGSYSNLAQGQVVRLENNGVSYAYAVDYFGGTGNDLVLQWADNRVVAWGANTKGQLGDGTLVGSGIGKSVELGRVLAGKAIRRVVGGTGHSVAVCVDGTLAAWGDNSDGQLGDGSLTSSTIPVAVDMEGVLAGKIVIQVACGSNHTLALCSDGTVAAWGNGGGGKLGYGASNSTAVPVLVNRSGVLAGRRVIAVSAGAEHSIALCSDGTLVKWGSLLDSSSSSTVSTVPVPVDQTGVLAGKTVVAIDAGGAFDLVLCADGTLAAWGQQNHYGALGDNGVFYRNSVVPVLVDRSGVLFGKQPLAMAAGASHSLTVCSDGTLAAWGYGYNGELGNGATFGNGATYITSPVPLLTNRSGVLAGRTVVELLAGDNFSVARCSDGSLAAWGAGTAGQLGNDPMTSSALPVLVNLTWLADGERIVALGNGGSQVLAVVATTPKPQVTTLAATLVNDTAANLQGAVNGNGATVSVAFEYGLTDAYGTTVAATPASATGKTATAVSAPLGGLTSGLTYHYRVVATMAGGAVRGEDQTFTTTVEASLATLSLSTGALQPMFAAARTTYHATVPFATGSLTLKPVTAVATSTVTVAGIPVTSGQASTPIVLAVGETRIDTVVTAADGSNVKTYTVAVTRLPELFALISATTVPLTVGNLVASGQSVPLVLGFAPPTGVNLTVVRNTGNGPIIGTFSGLAQGQTVHLEHGGVNYDFAVNYFGGDGNDLVLQWANTRLLAWGFNYYGQLGNGTSGSSATSLLPVPVTMSGVLAGKTVVAVATGEEHSLALCADGTLAAWGNPGSGSLGNGSVSGVTNVPLLVDVTGVLAGKTVVAVAAGGEHSLALCSDGAMAAWGQTVSGQLGNNSTSGGYRSRPVAVDQTGVLAGRKVVAIAARSNSNMVLCDDGTVAGWGANSYGQLGTGTTLASKVPVMVERSGVLAGKRVTAIASGWAHVLALCSDGTLVAWGLNSDGQLGNGSTTDSSAPVLVNRSGVLAGKTVIAIASGFYHNLVLCSDGTLAAWGSNNGKLGNNSSTRSSVPVLVDRTGVLAGKTVIHVAGGHPHSLAVCDDGTLAAWGYSGQGQLGNNSTTASLVPVLVSTSPLAVGERPIAVAVNSSHNLALTALPPPPGAVTMAASGITTTGATLNGTANGSGVTTTVSFEYGLTTAYGFTVAATPPTVGGNTATAVSSPLGGLTAGTTYHYRVIVANPNGTAKSGDMTFTTLSDNPRLADLALGDGTMLPGFESLTTNYIATVPFATAGLTVTPMTEHPKASVQVNGMPMSSGAASGVIPLAVGNNTLTTRVTAEDGITTMTYTITVNRLPQEFVFNSERDIPVVANGFTAGGNPVIVRLNFAPAPGTILTMVNNTALGFIHGQFGNLVQGQRVSLTYGGKVYDFVANYFGGTGNDLVLQWAGTELAGWGNNNYGQLGDGSTERRLLPADVDNTGVLKGKTIIAVSAGYLHSLALCSDGTLASWGYNAQGQLGDGGMANSNLPVAVDLTGLQGRTVIAISSGPFHNLALCSDGRVAAWGYNNNGQLGTGDKAISRVPVLVNPVGALAGKQVVSVATAAYHSFALCADGTVAAWGYNDEGELGDGTTASSMVPVAVDATGILSGRKVAMISAGQYHTLAVCMDGTIVSWGYNNRGQLGNSGTTDSSSPVEIGSTGALAGRTVVALAASGSHSLALCSDGSLAAWGYNNLGQLGATGISQSTTPTIVTLPQALAGRPIAGISAGAYHNLLRFTDGTMAAWGDNANGQLGNNRTVKSADAVWVDTNALEVSGPALFATSGSAALHNLAVVATPAPDLTAMDAWRIKNFGIAATTDDAADLADCDHDGIVNLVEYAFGLDPNKNSAGKLPQARRIGDRIVLEFSRPQGVSGIGYGAEWSPNLQPGSWQEVPDSGSGDAHVFSIPVDAAPSMFLRLRVRVP